MVIPTQEHSSDRYWRQTKIVSRGPSNRWTKKEESFYIGLALKIGDLTRGVQSGIRRILDLGSLPLSPFEIGDLVQAQNPDIIVKYPWLKEGVKSNDDNYPFTVQRRIANDDNY